MTGAILSQLCDDEKWHPVGFTSKSLSPAERNYTIYDKELLSVIRRLEEWRHILEGTKHTIEVLNDHRNLTYFRTAQTLNRHQARWSLYLSQFDYSLTHRAGKHSAKPDALSRWIDHQVEGEDNKSQVMLPTERFAGRTPVDRTNAYGLKTSEPSPHTFTSTPEVQKLWTESAAAPTEMNRLYVP